MNEILLFHDTAKLSDVTVEGNVVKGIEIFRIGTFQPGNWGGKKLKASKKYLDDIVSNFKTLKDDGILPNVPMRLDHSWSVKDIAGYIVDCYRDGDRLKVDVEFTEPDAFDLYSNGTIRNRSAEIGTYTDNNNVQHHPVLLGFAWVDLPAVEGLADVAAASKGEIDSVIWLNESEFKQVDDGKVAELEAKISELEATIATLKAPKKREVLMFGIKDVASFTLKDGSVIEDPSKLEMPKPEVFELSMGEGGETLRFADQASFDHVKGLVDKVTEYETKAAEATAKLRSDYVDGLKASGRILGSEDNVNAVKDLVKGFDDAQFEAYKTQMDAQPPLVKIDQSNGEQHTETDEDPAIAEKEAVLASYERTGDKPEDVARLKKEIADLKAAKQS